MGRIFWTCVALVGFLSFVALASGDEENESVVVALTDENFEEFITSHKFVCVKFHADWCGHCKSLAPDFEKVASFFLDEKPELGLVLAELNGPENPVINEKMGVKGFPTMLVFTGSMDSPLRYDGGRDVQSLTTTLQKMIGAPTEKVELADLEDVLTKHVDEEESVVVVARIPETGKYDKFLAKFRDFARTKMGTTFLEVVDPVVTKPEIEVVRPFVGEERVLKHVGPIEKFGAFLDNAALPIFGPLSRETAAAYVQSKLPLGVLFMEVSAPGFKKDLAKLRDEVFIPAAKEVGTAGKMFFCYVDNSVFGSQRKRLGLPEETKVPVFAIDDLHNGQRFPLLPSKDGEETFEDIMTFERVRDLANGYITGELETYIRSEPVPENPLQEDGVFKLVAKTFTTDVFQETHDVLVKIYAPWCGHCKSLAPKYAHAAQLFAKHGLSTLRMADMDGTENDLPKGMKVQGYPTVMFFPAGSKDASDSVEFSEERNIVDLVTFMLDNASSDLNVDRDAILKEAVQLDGGEGEEQTTRIKDEL
jgi:protein disulfide-isomerase A1